MSSFPYTLCDSEDGDYHVEVEYSPGYYRPARLSGHPDSWAPEEGEPPEILSVTDVDGKDILRTLSEKDIDKLIAAAMDDQADKDAYDPYDEPFDEEIYEDDWQDAQSDWERSQGI